MRLDVSPSKDRSRRNCSNDDISGINFHGLSRERSIYNGNTHIYSTNNSIHQKKYVANASRQEEPYKREISNNKIRLCNETKSILDINRANNNGGKKILHIRKKNNVVMIMSHDLENSIQTRHKEEDRADDDSSSEDSIINWVKGEDFLLLRRLVTSLLCGCRDEWR